MSVKNVFGGLADMIGSSGFDSIVRESARIIEVNLDDLSIGAQEREEFDTEDDDLKGLGETLQEIQIHTILIRPIKDGPKPYELIAGERRVRGARAVGKTTLWAWVVELSDEQAERARFIENIQRKNLTQIEEARRIRKDVDRYGVQATLDMYKKSNSWLSKRLTLLDLPEHAKRLVAENISADIEVIGMVRTIEKDAPERAAELVDTLRDSRGQTRARTQTREVLDVVKRSKKGPATAPLDISPAAGAQSEPAPRPGQEPQTPPPLTFVLPGNLGQVELAAPLAEAAPETFEAVESHSARASRFDTGALDAAYLAIYQRGQAAIDIVAAMDQTVRADITAWLSTYSDLARQTEDTGRAVIDGFRKGTFAADGAGAFALAAFLYGKETGDNCEIERILSCAQP